MKNFTKLCTLILFIGLSYFSKAQSPVVAIDASDLNSCNGYAYLSDSTQYVSWSWYAQDSLIQTDGILMGLCPGEYSIEVMENGILASYYFSIGPIISDSCAGFYAQIGYSNITLPGACDGIANVYIQGGTAPYAINWNNGQTGTPIENLCEGVYTVTVVDANACAFTTSAYITADSSNWNNGLSAYVYTNSPSMTGLCDGSAYVDVYGGVSPYTFEHSNGDLTQNPANLCAGIYTVTVTDFNGESQILNYIVPEFEDIFNGGNFDDSTIVDTLNFGLIEDCLIDYNTLDTAFISNIEYVSMDSILVSWSVVDGNGTVTFLQSYTISTGVGVYELILQIFCPQRSGTDYVYAYDQIYFNPATADVIDGKVLSSKVFPNPFENSLKIQLENALATSIKISDITGKIIYVGNFTDSEIEINTENFSKGQYFVSISNKEINTTLKIVK